MLEAVLTWWDGWIPAFALTCVIEVGVYLLMFAVFGLAGRGPADPAGTDGKRRLGWGRAAVLAVTVNVVSHPLFWAVALQLRSTRALVIAELVVVAVEALLILAVVRRSWSACLISALVANAASAVLGSVLLPALTSSWAS